MRGNAPPEARTEAEIAFAPFVAAFHQKCRMMHDTGTLDYAHAVETHGDYLTMRYRRVGDIEIIDATVAPGWGKPEEKPTLGVIAVTLERPVGGVEGYAGLWTLSVSATRTDADGVVTTEDAVFGDADDIYGFAMSSGTEGGVATTEGTILVVDLDRLLEVSAGAYIDIQYTLSWTVTPSSTKLDTVQVPYSYTNNTWYLRATAYTVYFPILDHTGVYTGFLWDTWWDGAYGTYNEPENDEGPGCPQCGADPAVNSHDWSQIINDFGIPFEVIQVKFPDDKASADVTAQWAFNACADGNAVIVDTEPAGWEPVYADWGAYIMGYHSDRHIERVCLAAPTDTYRPVEIYNTDRKHRDITMRVYRAADPGVGLALRELYIAGDSAGSAALAAKVAWTPVSTTPVPMDKTHSDAWLAHYDRDIDEAVWFTNDTVQTVKQSKFTVRFSGLAVSIVDVSLS